MHCFAKTAVETIEWTNKNNSDDDGDVTSDE